MVQERSDKALIKKLKEVLENIQNESGIKPHFIARTETIGKARKICKLYKDEGFNVEVVSSDNDRDENLKTIQNIKAGELDGINGIIGVDMVGEGLDIPTLKVLVFHDIPKSFPYTLQFIGRITRNLRNDLKGKIILTETEKLKIKDKLLELYREDVGWEKILDFAEKEIERQKGINLFHVSRDKLIDYFLRDEGDGLNIYFSVQIFRWKGNIDNLQPNKDVDDLVVVYKKDKNAIVCITWSDKRVPWIKEEFYENDRIDLHIIYNYRKANHNLLFLHTTDKNIFSKLFRNSLSGIEPLSYTEIIKAIQRVDEYVLLGLKNVTVRSSANPTYKTFAGKDVQNSIRLSDGKKFGAGYIMARTGNSYQGIAESKSRVWKMQRGNLGEFIKWCDSLAEKISNSFSNSTLPLLENLAKVEKIGKIEGEPFAVIPERIFYVAQNWIVDYEGKLYGGLPKIEKKKFIKDSKLICTFALGDFKCDFVLDLSKPKEWKLSNEKYRNVVVEIMHGLKSESLSLSDLFKSYPPMLIMSDGCAIVGDTKYIPHESSKLGDDVMMKKDWKGCDITSEEERTNKGESIFSKTY